MSKTKNKIDYFANNQLNHVELFKKTLVKLRQQLFQYLSTQLLTKFLHQQLTTIQLI